MRLFAALLDMLMIGRMVSLIEITVSASLLITSAKSFEITFKTIVPDALIVVGALRLNVAATDAGRPLICLICVDTSSPEVFKIISLMPTSSDALTVTVIYSPGLA